MSATDPHEPATETPAPEPLVVVVDRQHDGTIRYDWSPARPRARTGPTARHAFTDLTRFPPWPPSRNKTPDGIAKDLADRMPFIATSFPSVTTSPDEWLADDDTYAAVMRGVIREGLTDRTQPLPMGPRRNPTAEQAEHEWQHLDDNATVHTPMTPADEQARSHRNAQLQQYAQRRLRETRPDLHTKLNGATRHTFTARIDPADAATAIRRNFTPDEIRHLRDLLADTPPTAAVTSSSPGDRPQPTQQRPTPVVVVSRTRRPPAAAPPER